MAENKLFRKKSISSILTNSTSENGMKRELRVVDLTALGIAAIVGAGIFSTIGNAAASGGPAVSMLFIFTAIACGFSALAYAQFASAIPVAGSAYTYAYASFGELMAWIIGWDLIMEYSVGNIAVAISWSEYFTTMLSGTGINLPAWMCTDYVSAMRGFKDAAEQIAAGIPLDQLSRSLQEAFTAWNTAPSIAGIRLIADIPAFSIVVFITILVYVGVKETRTAGNLMVLIKLLILALVIITGVFFVNTDNWVPFAPHGATGVLSGVAAVFFAYIGFDAISTTAEEARNPKRDLPRAMIYALLITTAIYVMISLVLTGMIPSNQLGVADPLAYAFEALNLKWLTGIISVSAIIAMAGVLLVFQYGQPRIWMSMSRDGLLPRKFSTLHPKFKTPGFSTIITGVIVAIPSLFLNLTEVTDLTSIGTLFAFLLVSGGILILDPYGEGFKSRSGGFVVPYFNSRYWLIPILIASIYALYHFAGDSNFLAQWIDGNRFQLPWNELKHLLPELVFLILAAILTVLSSIKKWSLIPVLGLLTNGYLIAQLGIINWMRFIIWLVVGLVIYFTFGKRHSILSKPK
ncbi:MAG: amino acid permease [Sphingobacteriia bacterium]|nr:amino acid permease [Sphingobacteriia bacterium]